MNELICVLACGHTFLESTGKKKIKAVKTHCFFFSFFVSQFVHNDATSLFYILFCRNTNVFGSLGTPVKIPQFHICSFIKLNDLFSYCLP